MKVEFSNGDIVDRYTILSIKVERVVGNEKKNNVQKEYSVLQQALVEVGLTEEHELCAALRLVNTRLWEIEDEIRIKEKKKEFDDEFIHLARSVYIENDERARLKREINIMTNSTLVEEKQYEDYK